MRSACRGEARNTSAPKRAMSNLGPPAAIISMAQQARPNPMGQSEFFRAQPSTSSTVVVMMFLSKRLSMRPMACLRRAAQRRDVYF